MAFSVTKVGHIGPAAFILASMFFTVNVYELVMFGRQKETDGGGGFMGREIQLSLLGNGSTTAKLAGLIPAIKAAMHRVICEARPALSREQVLDRMNRIAGEAGVKLSMGNARKLALPTLEKWLNPGDREHLPSILALHVFCLAVGNLAPFALLVGLHGYEVMTPEDRRLRDYGLACIESRLKRKTIKRLEEEIENGRSHGIR